MVSIESCLSECTVSIVYLIETFLSPRFIVNSLPSARTKPPATLAGRVASHAFGCERSLPAGAPATGDALRTR